MSSRPRPSATASIPALRRRLLAWYRRHRRELPWRRTCDPYRVWLSEVMLQQTRAGSVVPYYTRFLRRFPSVGRLAAAAEESVLSAWAGLGYYRRARLLHRAAREIVECHGGRVPDEPAALRSLPGIGRYTCGAILSICFDRPEPIVDGNVERVLTRVFLLDGDPRRSPLAEKLWSLAGALARGRCPGDLNQALMDLGATLCVPGARARCPLCPIESLCRARKEGRVADLPARARKTPPRRETWAVAALARDGRYLLRRRAPDELLAGFWELPAFPAPAGPTGEVPARLRRWLQAQMRRRLGVAARIGALRLRHRQVITQRAITFVVFAARSASSLRPPPSPLRFASAEDLGTMPLTTAARKILTRLEAAEPRGDEELCRRPPRGRPAAR